MSVDTVIEIVGILFSLTYLYFLIKQDIKCWYFGIISSLISVYIFVNVQLYSEAILYGFYVLSGMYGLYIWKKANADKDEDAFPIKTLKWFYHLAFVSLGILLTFGFGWLWKNYTDAAKPFADSFSTVFSFIATFLEAHKVLDGWYYWIILNCFSVWLYFSRGLNYYSGLMVIYSIVSFYGFYKWNQKHKLQLNTSL